MPCDTRLKPKQTLQERAAEVRRAVVTLDKLIVAGQVRITVGPQGAVAFSAWADIDRDGVTDACAYRRLMVSGSALAKAKIAQAEQMSGRSIDKQALAHGHHSHDGGKTWHHGH